MKTLVMIKPKVDQKIVGGIIGRLANEVGLRVVEGRFVSMLPSTVQQFYAHHVDKDFWPRIESYMTSAPVGAFIMEGSVEGARKTVLDIRLQYKHVIEGAANLVHASETPEDAIKESEILWGETSWEKLIEVPDKHLFDMSVVSLIMERHGCTFNGIYCNNNLALTTFIRGVPENE